MKEWNLWNLFRLVDGRFMHHSDHARVRDRVGEGSGVWGAEFVEPNI